MSTINQQNLLAHWPASERSGRAERQRDTQRGLAGDYCFGAEVTSRYSDLHSRAAGWKGLKASPSSGHIEACRVAVLRNVTLHLSLSAAATGGNSRGRTQIGRNPAQFDIQGIMDTGEFADQEAEGMSSHVKEALSRRMLNSAVKIQLV